MAQSNRGFSPGKMNQDIDERLVPSGEYREAQNIQISSSDYSDAGSAQSILGNTLMSAGLVPSGSTCVGSIAYEKEDKIYYFVAGPKYDPSVDYFNPGVWKDYIIEYDIKTETFKYVFVDIYRVHYETIIDSVDRKLYINDTSSSLASNARKEMFVNGYDPAGNHIIVSDDSEVVEVTEVQSSNGPYVEIYSSSIDYNNTVVPSNTLIQCVPRKRILNFNAYGLRSKNQIITGINIIDGMIFWTDNHTEPKKINIKRCIAGTGGDTLMPTSVGIVFDGDNANWHTRLCITPDKNNTLRVKRRNETEVFYTEEENVTVIRKAPKTAPRLVMSRFEDNREGDTFSVSTTIVGTPIAPIVPIIGNTNSLNNLLLNGDITPKEVGEEIKLFTDNPVHWKVGDIILFNQQQNVNSPQGFNEHDVRATVLTAPGSMPSTGPYDLTIQSIDRNAIDAEEKPWNLRLEQKAPMFEFKFVRFAYRYKYEDGEYSTFSPFSEPAFLPGEYDYLPKKGFNLGMTNRLRSLKITDYITEVSERPQDVVEVDILFKEETSPNIYVVETIKMTDGWSEKGEKLWPDTLNGPDTGVLNFRSRGEYEVTSELISATLPSNQLLRSYDNVPRKALAQSISANRLVYGNYVQNFNMTDDQGCEVLNGKEIKPLINVSLKSFDTPLNAPPGTSKDPLNGEDTGEGFPIPRKTVRSLRTYQVGVVYGDEYGRETPVLSGEGGSGSIKVDIKNSSTTNKLRVDIATPSPDWAYYYKFFIKETSNEYYNMAMDRFYAAEDGNIWLSFASADRNKVDLETFIILKKKQDSQEAVTDNARYKILAIENEAPDFIKTNIKVIGQLQDDNNKNDIGTSGNGFPMPDFDQFWCRDDINGFDEMFSGVGDANARLIDAVNKGELYARARTQTIRSEWYQISHYLHDSQAGYLKFKSDKAFGEDMAFTSANTDYASRISGLRVELARFAVENKKEFEGRFFVKIYKDLILTQNLLRSEDIDYRVRSASPIHYFNMPWGRSEKITQGFIANGTGADNKYVSWERCGVNLEGDIASVNANTDKNDLFASVYGGGSNDQELFFATANDNYKFGVGPLFSCSFQEAVEKWCERSTGRFFFDAKWVRASRAANMRNAIGGETCRSDGNTPYDGELGQTRGLGIHNAAGDNMSMDIGYISPSQDDYVYGTQEDEAFINLLMTVGTTFRFREDPDGIIYRVINSEGTTGTDSSFWSTRYGLHHNYDDETSKEPGNNVWRWRIDVEVDNLPGVGLGKGPNGYFPLGAKSTTAVDDRQELGYWGGRHGSENWNSNNAWGDDEFGDGHNTSSPPLRVPSPYGYNSSFLVGDGTIYNNVDTGESVSGREQVKRWRHHATRFHHIEIVEPMEDEDNDFISDNPAIWETEPKEDAGVDIYYEASPALPLKIDFKTNEMSVPYGSLVVDGQGANGTNIPSGIKVTSWSDNEITLDGDIDLGNVTGSRIGFVRPDGLTTYLVTNDTGITDTFTIRQNPVCPAINNNHSDAPHNQPVDLGWFNAYAFGNGVESDRIRDDFNQTMLANGVKASSTIAVQYKEERRKTGLIHSGLYNSTSGLNELNQFIAAEKITKDMNPEYGSIQKLHTRDGDILVMHEDKIMKVLANKDALYNADQGANVAVADNFLGSDRPFSTKYGISTNPESFATDLYGRVYFTDRARSAVLRLSGDGITNISDYGMKYWFNRYFNAYTNYIIGSYDTKKDLYNVTVDGLVPPVIPDGFEEPSEYNNGCGCLNTVSQNTRVGSDSNGDSNDVYRVSVPDIDRDGKGEVELPSNLTPFTKTLSFSETSKGWVSFKTFIPESAVSINNEYYTFKDGMMYKHHSNSRRNFFYGEQFDSYVDLIFNDQPEVVKTFSTLSYEGSQSRITKHLSPQGYSDNQYYNLNDKSGWYIEESTTDLQSSGELEFKDKEGKYFTFMKGNTTTLSNLDESEFSVQGVGILKSTDWRDLPDNQPRELFCLSIQPQPTCGAIFGCTDPTSTNYNPIATVDDGSCLYNVSGCTDDNTGDNPDINGNCVDGTNVGYLNLGACGGGNGYKAVNYDPSATVDDGSCAYNPGCTDPTSPDYNSNADIDDGSCGYGCVSGPYIASTPANNPGEYYLLVNNVTTPGGSDGSFSIAVRFHLDAWNTPGSSFDIPGAAAGLLASGGNIFSYTSIDGINYTNVPVMSLAEVATIAGGTYPTMTPVVPNGISFSGDVYFNFQIAGRAAGFFRFEVIDPNGCMATIDFQITEPSVTNNFSACNLDGSVDFDFSTDSSGNTPGWEEPVAITSAQYSYDSPGQETSLNNAFNWYSLQNIEPVLPGAYSGSGYLNFSAGAGGVMNTKFDRIAGELYAGAHDVAGQSTWPSQTQITQFAGIGNSANKYVQYVNPNTGNRGWQSVEKWSFLIQASETHTAAFLEAVFNMIRQSSFSGSINLAPGGSIGSGTGLVATDSFGNYDLTTWMSNFHNVTSTYTPGGSFYTPNHPVSGNSGGYHSSGTTDMKILNTGNTGAGPFEIDLGKNWAEVCSNLSLMNFYASVWMPDVGVSASPVLISFWGSPSAISIYEWGSHGGSGTYVDDPGISSGNIVSGNILNGIGLDSENDDPWAVRLYLYNFFIVYGAGTVNGTVIHTYSNPFHCKLSNCSHASSI